MVYLCRTRRTSLGFSDRDERPPVPYCRCRIVPLHYGGGLRILAGDSPQPPNVLVCSAVRKPLPERVDPGARGLRDIVYGGGLRMCTEDLGSESGAGWMDAEEMAGRANDQAPRWMGSPRRAKATDPSKRRPRLPPPPPLPWLAGGRTRFMRAVREGGRLRLTEVRIERPMGIFRATREGGRLRLDLVDRSEREEDEERNEATTVIVDEEHKGDNAEEEEEEAIWAPPVTDEQVVTPTRTGDERRCQVTVSGNAVPLWWNHRPVMTA
ncbi:hypothetical protein Cni_G11915 [Canna indica]|uniref:FAF domain-containing protein n=1 Tax=Canna indica TaxID=4628 RepID=A0AAQ3QC67_9LILI|nr:hypothetical protein Cni_G11915 [Canna indica]